MRAVVFGVLGFAGSAIAAELLARGHEVVGITRTASDRVDPAGVEVRIGSVYDSDAVIEAGRGADWIVVATTPIDASGATLADAVPSLVAAAGVAGSRLAFVGGTGSLITGTGAMMMDQPGYPAAIRPVSQAHLAVLEALRSTEGVDWFQLCPSGMFGAKFPGERTGVFRLGGERLLIPPSGQPAISGADYAIAMVDELETPTHHRERFTVGY